jgi:hypothetical protein
MRKLTAALFCGVLLACATAIAQEVTINPNDSTQTVLASQKGKRVTVRLRSGLEMIGLVRDVNSKVVVLGAVGGREFFDAVVPLDAVEAVLVRVKQ